MKGKVLGAFVKGRRVWAWFAVLLIVMSLITVPSGRAGRVMAEGEGTTHLKDLKMTVAIKDVNTDQPVATNASGQYIIWPNNPYNVTLTFDEDGKAERQVYYEDGGELTYNLPEGLSVPGGASGSATVVITNGSHDITLDQCTYNIQDDKLTFTWDYGTDDPDEIAQIEEYLLLSSGTDLMVTFRGQFDGQHDSLDFNDDTSIEIEYKDTVELDVTKEAASFNKETGMVDYIISVKATGNNKNIHVEDVFQSPGILASDIDISTITARDQSSWEEKSLTNIQSTGNGFTCVIENMDNDECIEILYSAKLDMSKFSPESRSVMDDNIYLTSTDDTTNTVTLSPQPPSTNPGPFTATADLDGVLKYPCLTKKGTAGEPDEDGVAVVDWTVSVKSYYDACLANKTLSDVFTSFSELVTNGERSDFKVERTVYTKSGSTYSKGSTEDITPAEDSTALSYSVDDSGWEYILPDERPNDSNEYYEYTISYKTNVDVSGKSETVEVSNTATVEDYASVTNGVGVGPAQINIPDVNKSVSAGHEYMDWTVTVDIPAVGIDSSTPVTLEDVYPSVETGETGYFDENYNWINPKYQDTLVGDVTVEWPDKTDNESYSIDTSDASKFVIEFTKTAGEHTYGFEGTGVKRTITLKYRTKNDSDWMQKSDDGNTEFLDHKNVATLKVNGDKKDAIAIGRSVIRKMEKSVFTENTDSEGNPVYIKGLTPIYEKLQQDWWDETMPEELRYYDKEIGKVPYYLYDIVLSMVDESLFDDGEGGLTKEFVVTDTFDGDYLLYEDSDSLRAVITGGDDKSDYYGFEPMGGNQIEVDSSKKGVLKFRIKESDLPKKGGGEYYSFYRIEYGLRLADLTTESKLAALAASSPSGKYILTNTAEADSYTESSVDVPYAYNLVEKKITGPTLKGATRSTTFSITVNPNGLDMAPYSDELTVTDTFENLSIDLRSISAEVDNGSGYVADAAYPNNKVNWIMNNGVITFTIPDELPVRITYEASVIGLGHVTYSNEAKILGRASRVSDTESFTSSAVGTSEFVGVYILKHDSADMTKTLGGVQFALYDADTDELKKVFTTSEADGSVLIAGSLQRDGWEIVKGKRYYVQEVEDSQPEGYRYDDKKYFFTVSESDDNIDYSHYIYKNGDDLTIKNETVDLEIPVTKVWIGSEGEKAEFRLMIKDGASLTKAKDKNGNDVKNLTLTKSDNWKGSFTNLPRYTTDGTKIDYVVEELPVFGFTSNGGVWKNSEIFDKGIVFTNTARLVVTKLGKFNEECVTDSDETKPLAGVEFTIYQESTPDTPYEVRITGADGKVEFSDLPAGNYILKETTTVGTYKLSAETYKVVIEEGKEPVLKDSAGNEIEDKTIVNDVYRADINLLKVNESNTDQKLPSSTYGLYKADTEGNAVLLAKGITDAEGVLSFNGVLTGVEYTIKELEAPDGFYVSEQPIRLKFVLTPDKQVVFDAASFDTGNGTATVNANGEITWLEPIVKATFAKVDESGKPLAGATLHVEDAGGKVIETWTTDDKLHSMDGKLNCGETYKLVEDKAPAGYKLAAPKTFSIEKEMGPNKAVVVTLSMTDEKEEATTEATTEKVTTETTTEKTSTEKTATEVTTEVTTEKVTTEKTTTEKKTTETDEAEDEEETTEKKTGSSAKTGDAIPIYGVFGMFVISVYGICLLNRRREDD